MGRKTDTRERLIEAAIAVIEADGEQAFRLSTVADAVGVSTPSIYHFFNDREELLVAALAEMYRRSQAAGIEYLMGVAQHATTVEQFEAALLDVVDALGTEEAAKRRSLQTSVLGAAVNRPLLQSSLVEMHRYLAGRNRGYGELGLERGFVQQNYDFDVLALFAGALFADRHYAEIDNEVDRAEWDAIVFETVRHLLFDRIERRDRAAAVRAPASPADDR